MGRNTTELTGLLIGLGNHSPIDDGSKACSYEEIHKIKQCYPDSVKVTKFIGNFVQVAAIIACFFRWKLNCRPFF